MEERPGLVDCQVETLDENARGMERSIVTALAGDGRRDSGKVGSRPGKPLVLAAGRCGYRNGCGGLMRSRPGRGTAQCRGSGRLMGTLVRRRWRVLVGGDATRAIRGRGDSLPIRPPRRIFSTVSTSRPCSQAVRSSGGGKIAGARGFEDRGLPDSWFLGELSIVRESLRCGRSISRACGPRVLLCFTGDRLFRRRGSRHFRV